MNPNLFPAGRDRCGQFSSVCMAGLPTRGFHATPPRTVPFLHGPSGGVLGAPVLCVYFSSRNAVVADAVITLCSWRPSLRESRVTILRLRVAASNVGPEPRSCTLSFNQKRQSPIDSEFFDTLSREFLMLIPMGRSEDIWLALRRRESSGCPVGARQSLNETNRGTPWKKAPNDCDHPPTAIQKGGNAMMYHERCEMCGNRWQRVPLTMVARDPETTLNNRTVLASTWKRPVEIERPFCPHGHRSMMMQATPQQRLHWECSTCSTTSGRSLDECDVRLVDWGSFEGADANMVPIGDEETPCL